MVLKNMDRQKGGGLEESKGGSVDALCGVLAL